MTDHFRLEGHLTPEHVPEKWVYVPFQVPEGATRVSVTCSERGDPNQEGDTLTSKITAGLFDARGNDFITGGFRGWSGGKNPEFFIAPDAATPGFLRGPIQSGEWSLMLSCPEIAEGRLSYCFDIDVDVNPGLAAQHGDEFPNPMRELAMAVAGGSNGNGGRWYKGDLHAHSIHSDGKNPVDEIIEYVERAGLDYFALTDHNTVSHYEDLVRLNTGAPLLMGGEEVTMPGGHAMVWGTEGWTDFRVRNGDDVQRLIDDSRARGSMFSINHPDSPIPWRHTEVKGFQGMEVWNAPWRYYNEPALIRWQYYLNRGKRIVAVGGSDSHCVPPAEMTQPNMPGEPCTWVYVEGPLTQKSVLDAVEAGHVFISEGPTGPFLEMRADGDGDGRFETLVGDVMDSEPGRMTKFHLKYRGPEGAVLRLHSRKMIVGEIKLDTEIYDGQIELAVEGRDYVRAEVRGYRGRPDRGEVVHALTNPIYWGKW